MTTTTIRADQPDAARALRAGVQVWRNTAKTYRDLARYYEEKMIEMERLAHAADEQACDLEDAAAETEEGTR